MALVYINVHARGSEPHMHCGTLGLIKCIVCKWYSGLVILFVHQQWNSNTYECNRVRCENMAVYLNKQDYN